MKAKHFQLHRAHEPHLKRELSFFDAVVFGVGLIIGAGIYALIGKGAGIAGNSLWLSFVVGGFVALFSGLSYAELSSAFPKDAVEYNCARHATKSRLIPFIIGWITVFGGIAATAAVAVGFAGYLEELFGVPVVISAVLLIVFCAAIELSGTKVSTEMIFILTALEIIGLIIIMALGVVHISEFGPIDYFDLSFGWEGIFSAATLMFFAYIGFEGIANISEEVKDAKKSVPLAMIVSIIVTTVIYILIAVSAVSIADYRTLSESSAPMAVVADTAARDLGIDLPLSAVLSIIALFATSSTVLINTVVVSRILYGLRSEPAFPSALGRIHPKTKVPYISVSVVAAASVAFAVWGDISILASLSTFAVFTTFFCVNSSLILLRFDRSFKPKFRLPLSVFKMPLTAIIGAAWCLFMLFKFGSEPITYGSIAILAGILVFMHGDKP